MKKDSGGNVRNPDNIFTYTFDRHYTKCNIMYPAILTTPTALSNYIFVSGYKCNTQ